MKKKNDSDGSNDNTTAEKDEKKKYTFMQALNTIKNDKVKKRKEKNTERMAAKAKERAKVDEFFKESMAAKNKKRHRNEGKESKAREQKKSRGER